MIPRTLIAQHLDRCLTQTDFPVGRRYQGKVRDTYDLGDGRLLLVTTDRISAFDHVLPQPIPFKGQVLNGMAAHFFRETSDLVPNHIIDVPDPNVTVARVCTPFPIEFVVRGYLSGHAWRVYRAGGRSLCGAILPEGLAQNERFPTPLLTPSTKAKHGHDEDISPQEILSRGLLDGDTYEAVAELALSLFARGSEMAAQRGLILVDTKYEFGRDAGGVITLLDEIHTPDSSRYFYAEGYEQRLEAGRPQRQLSKEFVREWLLRQGFSAEHARPPDLPDDFRCDISERYIEVFEAATGKCFVPDTHPRPMDRVHAVLEEVLGA